ncbi:hypothetical protein [Jiella marina]|uniref:hypothetical protein n=1 Tax=Jiella sp. LLJ827 TaxID=2917712 RepID=UPI002100BDDC|nr:hypothetical protein [Jiella sp. LLJ827]MCQ0990631.1 hypothetical protein [Jiella sp. LLJ827]
MNAKQALTVTKDVGANQKILRKLEKAGYIKIYVSDMEIKETGSKIKARNSLPFGFQCDDKECKCKEGFSGFGDGSEEIPHSYFYSEEHNKLFLEIVEIVGWNNRLDCKQLMHHILNRRDIFVTEDRDILDVATKLLDKFQIIIKSPTELASQFLE